MRAHFLFNHGVFLASLLREKNKKIGQKEKSSKYVYFSIKITQKMFKTMVLERLIFLDNWSNNIQEFLALRIF